MLLNAPSRLATDVGCSGKQIRIAPPLASIVREACREPESGSLSRLARHTNLTSHEQRELPGDSESQSHTLVSSSNGAVDLREGVENALLDIGGNTDSRVLTRSAATTLRSFFSSMSL